MIYSKFMSKPVNFLPFALFQFFILISYHLHLFTLSYSQPPTSPLSPLPGLKQTPILPRNCLHQWTWTVIVISVFCVFFFILTCVLYVKWFEVSFTWRIGLLDKLKWVSSLILLALRWFDLQVTICVIQLMLCCQLLLLPIKYLKHKT